MPELPMHTEGNQTLSFFGGHVPFVQTTKANPNRVEIHPLVLFELLKTFDGQLVVKQ